MRNNLKDFTGARFGKLEVVRMEREGVTRAVCKCDCGGSRSAPIGNLHARSNCGCVPRDRKPVLGDLTGKVFGSLQVLRMEQRKETHADKKSGMYYAVCECNCGSPSFLVQPGALRRGSTTSCGCRVKNYRRGADHPQFKGFGEIPSRFWKGYIRGATDRGHDFSITIEYAWDLFLKQNRCCALSGELLVFMPGNNSNTTASIDRIDSSKGYLEGNIQWTHKKVNLMRNVLPVETFVEWCAKVTQHHST